MPLLLMVGFPHVIHIGDSEWNMSSFRKVTSMAYRKIYELVINNDPCYAYLMTSNDFTDQKLVMAHGLWPL